MVLTGSVVLKPKNESDIVKVKSRNCLRDCVEQVKRQIYDSVINGSFDNYRSETPSIVYISLVSGSFAAAMSDEEYNSGDNLISLEQIDRESPEMWSESSKWEIGIT